MKLFVYGTLKKNHSAHGILEHCEFLGGRILQGYSLYNYNGLPVLLSDEHGTVKGELYLIPPYDQSPTDPHHGGKIPVLSRLDAYEGYHGENNPNNLYNRIKAYTVDQEMVYVYVFNGDAPDAEPILDGEW